MIRVSSAPALLSGHYSTSWAIWAGYPTKTHDGRRNVYTVNGEQPMQHAAQGGHIVGALVYVLERGAGAPPAEAGDERSTGA